MLRCSIKQEQEGREDLYREGLKKRMKEQQSRKMHGYSSSGKSTHKRKSLQSYYKYFLNTGTVNNVVTLH